jgi:hypothetical protein
VVVIANNQQLSADSVADKHEMGDGFGLWRVVYSMERRVTSKCVILAPELQ